MAAPTYTPLPAAPARTMSPSAFSTAADAFLSALAAFQTEGDTLGAYTQAQAEAALAAAIAGNLAALDLTSLAGWVIGVNVAGTALEGVELIAPTQATETAVGVAELATEAEAQAGVDDLAMMTALKVKAAIKAQGFSGQLLHVREEQPSGTSAGTFTSGSRQTRVLNTIKTNEITGASFDTSIYRATLPAGDYIVQADAPAYDVGSNKAYLRNITDSADILIGTSEFASTTYNGFSRSKVVGKFTLAAEKVIELQGRCQTTNATEGMGLNTAFGDVEVYAEVMIWKVA